MEEFLNFVLKRLVDSPEEVIVSKVENGNKVNFFLKLQQEDIGKIIGKNGQLIGAIRSMVSASAQKHGQRAFVDIVE